MKKLFFIQLFFLSYNFNIYCQDYSPVDYLPQKFDVLKYSINLNLERFPENEIYGLCKTKLRFLDKFNSQDYKFSLRSLQIDSIEFINHNFQYDLEKIGMEKDNNFHYIIKPKNPFNIEDIPDTINISIYYHGKMSNEGGTMEWGGVSFYGNNIFSMGVGFFNNYVSCGQHWFPCYDLPSDKAEFEFKYITKPGFRVASNGHYKEEHFKDSSVYHFTHKYPTSTYLVNFAFDKFIIDTIKNDNNAIPILVYTQTEKKASSDELFKIIPGALKIYEKIFGNYPFEKIGYCLTSIGNMEHQTMISYDKNLVTLPISTSAKNVAVHEFAHQWFGNSVSPLDFRDAWLNESFATYSEALWIEKDQNWLAYLSKMKSDLNYYQTLSKNENEGFVSIYDFPREKVGNYPGTIYYKGSVVLGLLRFEFGDSLFFGFIKYYLEKYKYGNISTSKFKEEIENYTKKDLSIFFEQWIYNKGLPKLSVQWTYLNRNQNTNYSKIQLKINQTQDTSFPIYVNLPIELKFNSDSKYNKLLYLNNKDNVFEIDSLPYSAYIAFNQGEKLITPLLLEKLTFVDVNEVNLSENISPNPASDYIEITLSPDGGGRKWTLPSEQKGVIPAKAGIYFEIYNIFGEFQLAPPQTPPLEGRGLKIDVSNLPAGVYFIKIGDRFEKFVKI